MLATLPVAPSLDTVPMTTCFAVTADPEPGLLPRLIEPLAKRGLILDRLSAVTDEGDGGTMTVDMQLTGLPPQDGDIVAATLRQVVGVRTVLACRKSA